MLFFPITVITAYGILCRFNLKNKSTILIVILCIILHFAGSIFYWHNSLSHASDAREYFISTNTLPRLNGFLSTNFIIYLVYWLRYLIFGDSYLGIYAFFAYLGSIGSILYLVIYNNLIKKIKIKCGFDFSTRMSKFFELLIACWPSTVIWASNLGKDSLIFFLISLFFLSLLEMRKKKFFFILFLFSGILAFIIRPYLIIVGAISYYCWFLFNKGKGRNLLSSIFLFLVLIFVIVLLKDVLTNFGGIESFDYEQVVGRSIVQQNNLATGTHIPVPTQNPTLFLFILPYMMFANLLFPLFILAHNVMGFLASLVNLYLLLLIIKFLKNYSTWKILLSIENIMGYMLWFFLGGIALLGMVNTNLGLADREKIMYLPLFLIMVFITITFNKYKKLNSNVFRKKIVG